jgi:hypothetical protein
MDLLEPLIQAYQQRLSASAASKLDVLIDIERVHDARVVSFLLSVLGDSRENEDVRIHVLKRLRNGSGLVAPANGPAVARTIGDVLNERGAPNLRLEAALALGEFIQIEGVPSLLHDVCVAKDESIDLRYAAFTSLERAGPTRECIELLREISTDETLGRSARSVLSAWHIE